MMNRGKSWSEVKKHDGDGLYEDVPCSLHIFVPEKGKALFA